MAIVHSFSLLSSARLYGRTTVHSPLDGRLNCVQVLATAHLCVGIPFHNILSEYLGASRMAGSCRKCIFVGAFLSF